ncbi:sugar porter family MFS transporter [Cysteiniphilum sp. 6C5]|uniref:sugar porter family MFS transporter n=1 Tax=unclassified Cysteiniphilum TaxID=2610889 RepID=UPI003F8475CB
MKEKKLNAITMRVAIIGALAGLLFGMDIAYVNGSLDLIVKNFSLSLTQSEHVASTLLVGAAIGAIFSGFLSRRFGRKVVLILAALIFTLFTFVGVFAPNFDALLVSRFVVGLAVGIASFISPLYLSEIAPKEFRGGIIAMYQFMITIGIFLMYLCNSALSSTGSWRIMLASIAIPSIIMLLGCLTLPRSPRWLILTGQEEKALVVLKRIRDTEEEAYQEADEIKNATNVKGSGFKMLRHGFFLKVLLLGILLQAFQQFTGMNAFMYYSTDIFKMAGFGNPAVATIVIGLVNVLTTILAIKYVDKFGRKPILYFGLSLLVLSCLIVGVVFKTHYSVEMINNLPISHMQLSSALQWITLIFCLVFIFGFAISMGPMIWIICSEIQPLEGRDLGMTASTTSNWLCNAILGNFALTWLTFAPGNTFFGFGLVCLVCMLFTKFFVPETKGVSLEQIERNLKSGKRLAHIGR